MNTYLSNLADPSNTFCFSKNAKSSASFEKN